MVVAAAGGIVSGVGSGDGGGGIGSVSELVVGIGRRLGRPWWWRRARCRCVEGRRDGRTCSSWSRIVVVWEFGSQVRALRQGLEGGARCGLRYDGYVVAWIDYAGVKVARGVEEE